MPTTTATEIVAVGDLRAHTDGSDGDMLVGLDNGYVVDVDTDTDYVSLHRGLGGRLPDNMVLVTYHTADGDEAYLIAPEDMPVTIRERQS